MKDLAKSARKVIDAIENPGSNRQYHLYKLGEMKETWPTLYLALEELRIAVKKHDKKEGK